MKTKIRVKVKPHTRRLYRKRIQVRGYTRRILKNYGAFKFISPWEQFKKTGIVEPEYARFGADKIILPKERKIIELKAELQRLEPQTKKPEVIIEEEQAPEIDFSDEGIKEEIRKIQAIQKKQLVKETIKLPPSKGKEKTVEQLVHERKSREGQERKTQKELEEVQKRINDPFENINSWTEENKKRAGQVLLAKLTRDPRGRDISMPQKVQETINFVNQEIATGRQKAIQEVVSFQDKDFIDALKDAGFSLQDATDFVLRLPREAVIGKTPRDIVRLREEFESEKPTIKGIEFVSEEKMKSLSVEEVAKRFEDILKHRSDLAELSKNPIIKKQLVNKLRRELTEIGNEDIDLTAFFSEERDMTLKKSLRTEKDEKTFSSFRPRAKQRKLAPRELNFEDIRILPKRLIKLRKERDQTFDEMMKMYLHPEQRKLKTKNDRS